MGKGEIKNYNLAEQMIAAAKQHDDLNAFIYLNEKIVLEEADRIDALPGGNGKKLPLRGLPIAIKDNIHVADMPNTAGTPALRNFIPDKDSPVVAALREAGGIIMGKTNMHELAFGITSDNWCFGRVGNAYDSSLIAGGSSGGSAVSVAMGMAWAALGTDTGGSVRIPASLNGVCGFRPTIDRYSREGVTPISHTRDSVGTIASSVSDLIQLDEVLSTTQIEILPEISLSELRLGVPHNYFFEGLQTDVESTVSSLFSRLEQQGITLIDIDIPELAELNEEISFTVALHEVVESLKSYLLNFDIDIELKELFEKIATPHTRKLLEEQLYNPVSFEDYNKAVNKSRPLLKENYQCCFEKNNISALIFPTTQLTAKLLQEKDDLISFDGVQVPSFSTYIHNTDPGSNAGLSGLTVPIGLDEDGLPIGIGLDGLPQSDRELLAIGSEIERLVVE